MKAQAAWAIIRDIFTMLVGAAIALNEEFRSTTVRSDLLYLAGALLITPAGRAAVGELFRGKGIQPQADATPGSSQSSPSPPP